MLVTVLGLFAGLVGLYVGGEWLVSGAAKLARSLGISPLVVGLTVVSIGTSAPELLVSLSAALSGSSDMAIGNIVGSNIANIGLILGVSGLIYPISVHVNLLRREIPIMLGVAVMTYLLMRDATVSRLDGGLLVAGMIAFIIFMIVASRRDNLTDDETSADSAAPDIDRRRELLRLVVGIAVLMVGAQLTVQNATTLARAVGISELVIGVTLVAVGTSLPELVTSTMAAFRQESDIAIGNVVGSNLFNLLGILGATALISPVAVAESIIRFDALVMLGFSLLVIPFAFDRRLGRLEAVVFLGLYVSYVGYVILV